MTRKFDDLSPKDLITNGAVALLSRWTKKSKEDVLQWLMDKFGEDLESEMDALLADVAEGVVPQSESECSAEDEESVVFEIAYPVTNFLTLKIFRCVFHRN